MDSNPQPGTHPIHVMYRWNTEEEYNSRNEISTFGSKFIEGGITLVCTAKTFKNRWPLKTLNYISSAFKTKWFYNAETYVGGTVLYSQTVKNFVALSPDQVIFNEAELEQLYMNTRKIIG